MIRNPVAVSTNPQQDSLKGFNVFDVVPVGKAIERPHTPIVDHGEGGVCSDLGDDELAPDVIMAVAIDDEDLGAAADKLAAVLVDGEVERVDRFAAPLFNKPLILVGAGTKLARLLSSAELFGAPLDIYKKGDMRVWTATGGRGFPVLVIEVENAAQLTALTPRLPHYGAKSYLVFEDGDVIDSGVWPAKDKPLRFEF